MNKSPHNEAEDVFKDGNRRILTAGDVILSKGCPFIALEDGSTDHYTLGKMNQIYYTTDEEFGALEERSKQTAGRKKHRVGNQVMADSLRQVETNLQKSDCRHIYTSYKQRQL